MGISVEVSIVQFGASAIPMKRSPLKCICNIREFRGLDALQSEGFDLLAFEIQGGLPVA